MKVRPEWGSELDRIRTVRSWGSKSVILYEHALVHAPSGIAVPTRTATIEVRKGGTAGELLLGGATFGLAGLAVTRMRLVMTASGGGYSFTAWIPGRDANKVAAFVKRAMGLMDATPTAAPPPPPPADAFGVSGST